MHNIHAPVLIQAPNGFTFGVVVSKTITEIAKGEFTYYELDLFQREDPAAFCECALSELPRPSSYGSYGIHAVVESHPGYKWAIAESERRINEPELPLEPVATSPSSTEGGAK